MVSLRVVSMTALLIMAFPAQAENANQGINGPRTDQERGGSAYIQGNEGRGGTTLRGNGVSRTEDIRRTSSGKVVLSPAQVKKLRDAAKDNDLHRTDSVSFTVSVGAAVPAQSGAEDLPSSLQSAIPSGKMMRYVLVQDRLILIDKRTQRIVAIVPGIG